MTNRNIVIAIIVISLIAAGVWGIIRVRNNSRVASESQSQTNQVSQTNTDDNKTPVNQDQTNKPEMTHTDNSSKTPCVRDFDQTKLTNDKVDLKNNIVTIEFQDFGTVKVQLFDTDAPKTVENFLRLTNAHFYDCLTVHRVAKGFVIQAGDPKGDGTGGQSAFGAEFADELNANTASYKTGYVAGTLAMANRGPNTNSSQFFITLADVNAALPKNYTIFGKVIAGMDVVTKIGGVDINPGPFGPTDGAPKVPVIIKKALIGK